MLRTIVPSIYDESRPQLIVQSNTIVNYLHRSNRHDNRPINQNICNY